jgi:cytochrome P450
MYPPEHTRLRKLAQPAFTARKAALHAETVRELANRLIDGFVDRGQVDLVEPYCMAIPIRILGPILGISMEDAAQLRLWGIGTQTMIVNAAMMSEEELVEAAEAPIAMDRFVRALIEERRAAPRGESDLVTNLIVAESDDGDPLLTDDEIVGILTNSINGASDTSTATMGHCLRSLLEERSRWEAVLAEPELIENAIEEALRRDGPVWTMRRDTTRECVIGGVTIPAGAMVGLHFGSAGRDPNEFPDPDEFRLDRRNVKRHFGLGRGTHFCLGGALARVLLRESVGTLARRLPSLRLVPGHELEHAPSFAFNMLRGGLVVSWDERS